MKVKRNNMWQTGGAYDFLLQTEEERKLVDNLRPLSEETTDELEEMGELTLIVRSDGWQYILKAKGVAVNILKTYFTYNAKDDQWECANKTEDGFTTNTIIGLDESLVIEYARTHINGVKDGRPEFYGKF